MYKYVVLIPYYKRAGYLHNTLVSYQHFYANRNDVQLVIVEDDKNFKDSVEHRALIKVIETFRSRLNIFYLRDTNEGIYNPAPLFNLAARKTKSELIILTNPECFHTVDVFAGLDKEDPNHYILCGVQNYKRCKLWIEKFEDFEGVEHQWYQHSIHRNASLHFCSMISRKNWEMIGGFDDRFKYGVAYEDVYFMCRVIEKFKVPIVKRDDLKVIHMDHGGFIKPVNYNELLAKNRNLHIALRGT